MRCRRLLALTTVLFALAPSALAGTEFAVTSIEVKKGIYDSESDPVGLVASDDGSYFSPDAEATSDDERVLTYVARIGGVPDTEGDLGVSWIGFPNRNGNQARRCNLSIAGKRGTEWIEWAAQRVSGLADVTVNAGMPNTDSREEYVEEGVLKVRISCRGSRGFQLSTDFLNAED